MAESNYYSMRRLSPYQGTVQVVEIEGFRAMSADGISWRVQFLNQRSRFSSYGVWRADGSGNLIETGHTRAILEALRQQPALPFPAADRLELWLLDAKEHLPLAILASTLSHRTPPQASKVRWEPVLAGDDSFVAPSLASRHHDPARRASPIAHHAVISRCIQKATGLQAHAQWFRRDAEGNGAGLKGYRVDDAFLGRELTKDVFPELLLRTQWDKEEERALVRDYHEWQAPNLLTHSNLRRTTRDYLERAACKQAAKLYKVRHLLPEVVNTDLINVALVEAVIRRSA